MSRPQRLTSARERLALVSAVLLSALAFVVAAPQAAWALPSIAANPTSAPAGSQVSVSGNEFTAGLQCTLHIGSASLPPNSDPQQVGTCTVDGNGGLSGTFTVPGLSPGSYTLWACNGLSGNLCNHEFEERASAGFTVSLPPTTIPTTTTTQATTTTTTFPEEVVPIGIDVPALPDGYGLDEGIWGPSIPLRVVEGRFELPPDWLARCAPLATSTVWSFDDQDLGTIPEYPPFAPFFGPVIQPELGTISAPYAVRRPVPEVGITYGFHDPLGYFGIHVGLPEPTSDPIIVQLEARSFSGTHDADRVVLGPDPSPASTCLLVRWPEEVGQPASVWLRAFTPDGRSVDLDLDDVFFGTEQYPITPVPESAEVRFLRPLDGDTVRTQRPTVLLGEVRWPDGLDIDGVRITRPTWDRSGMDSSLAEVTRSWLMDDGVTRRALFWLDGVFAAPGVNDVEAFAYGPGVAGLDFVSFTGEGPATPPPDAYRDSVSGIVDIVPWAMEGTQAIRGPLVVQAPGSTITDDFNLVAGKPTVVRGYATQQFPGDEPESIQRLAVAAVLHATRGGATLPGSPLHPTTATAYLYAEAPGPASESVQRPYLGRTWNFELPAAWTTEGDVLFRLEVNPASDEGRIEEAPGTDGAENFIGQRVHFTDVGDVGLQQVAVDLYYRCDRTRMSAGVVPCSRASEGDVEHAAPTSTEIMAALADAWRLIPAPGRGPSSVTLGGLRVAERNPPSGSIDDDELDAPLLNGWLSGMAYDTVKTAYGDVNCPGDLMIFHTSLPWPDSHTINAFFNSLSAFGRCGSRGRAWVGELTAFVTEPDGLVFAHELGHSLGLKHLPGHDAKDPRSRWPDDNGELAQAGVTTYGFDVRDMLVIPPDGYFDLMSYGRPRWISVGTWDHMFDAFLAGAPLGDARSGADSDESDVGRRSDGLIVSGSTDGSDDGPDAESQPGRGVPLDPDESQVRIEVRAADGSVLGVVGAFLDGGSFSGFVPSFEGAHSIVVLRDGSVIGEIESSGVSLGVTLDPLPDLTGDTDRIEWTGPAGARYLVEASTDGVTWWTLGTTSDPWLDVDPSALPLSGDGWTVRVWATDGVGLGFDELGDVDFGLRPPVATIIYPVDGSAVPAGMASARAAASPFGGAEYSWFLDGDLIGSGPEVTLPLVAPGTHEVRLVVENEVGTDEAPIRVSVFEDSDRDGMDDVWEGANGLDPSNPDDGAEDSDGDGLPNVHEQRAGSDPLSVDTDGDDYSDAIEVEAGSDPADADSLPRWLGFEDAVPAPKISESAGGGGSFPWVPVLGGLVVLAAAVLFLLPRLRRR